MVYSLYKQSALFYILMEEIRDIGFKLMNIVCFYTNKEKLDGGRGKAGADQGGKQEVTNCDHVNEGR